MTCHLDNQKIKDYYLSDIHPKLIAAEMNVSVTTIINRLITLGVYVKGTSPRVFDIDDERIKRLYNNGFSSYMIAEEYGCHHMSILNRLKKIGVKRRSLTKKDKLSKEDIEEIKIMRSSKKSLREIASVFGVSFQAIEYHLKRA